MSKSRRMRSEGHGACTRAEEVITGCWWGNLQERCHLGDPGVDGRSNMKMDLQEVGWGHGLD